MKKITNELIKKFKNYLINEEKSQATVEKYIRDMWYTEFRVAKKQNDEKTSTLNIVVGSNFLFLFCARIRI